MAQTNGLFDTVILDHSHVVNADTDETINDDSFCNHEELDFEEIPASLLSYCETSKSRAAVCEKLILKEPEDYTASYGTEDTMNLLAELDKNWLKLNDLVICDTERNGDNTSPSTHIPPLPTQRETYLSHKVPVGANTEDEAETDEYGECEMHSELNMNTLEILVDEEDRLKSSGYQAEREKMACEELKKEKHKRQIENDFQKELKNIMEAEKLHQKELELMQKTAQEKLEQEMLLQQEAISELQRRVEEERRRMEEERRWMEEEQRRLKDEERIRDELERNKIEEEKMRKKEEERKLKKEEDNRKRIQQEEEKTRKEERHKLNVEKKRLEEEMGMMEEVQGKNREEMEWKEKDRKNQEEEKKKFEQEEEKKRDEDRWQNREEELKIMEEEERKRKEETERAKKEEDRKNQEKERRRIRQEMDGKREEERHKLNMEEKKREEKMKLMEEEERKKKEEMERMKLEKKMRMMEEEERKKKEEIERMKLEKKLRMMEEEDGKKKEEIERMKQEEEYRKRKQQEEKKKRKEERHKLNMEKRKKEGEIKMIEDEERNEKEEMERMKKDKPKKREENRQEIVEVMRSMEKDRSKKEDEVIQKMKELDLMNREQEDLRKEEESRKIIENEERENLSKKMNKEEEKRKILREDGRNREEIMRRDLEKKQLEDTMIRIKEKEERERTEKVKERKGEKERGEKEETNEKIKTDEQKSEDALVLKKEERTNTVQEKMDEEMKNCYRIQNGNQVEQIKVSNRKQEEEKEQEEKRKTGIEEKNVRQQDRERIRMMEQKPMAEGEKTKKEDKINAKEEEQRWTERDEKDYRKSKDRKQLKEDKEEFERYHLNNRKSEHGNKTIKAEQKQEEEEENVEIVEMGKREREYGAHNVGECAEHKINKETGEKIREEINPRMVQEREREVIEFEAKLQQEKGKGGEINIIRGQTKPSSSPGPENQESAISLISTGSTSKLHYPDCNISHTSKGKSMDCDEQETCSVLLPACLPDHTEQKRISWMKECIPWSKLSLLNRRKQKESVWSQRGMRRAAEANSLPALCPESLLQSTGCKSLKEVTTVTLKDLPGFTISTLALCSQLQSLTLRCCGLKSLEGINQLPQLCFVDAQENDISFVDCKNMTSLRVLRLSHNKLTSIHGLTGAQNLDVLDLSHNSITRIGINSGLESLRRLQRLSLDHNQLISTTGLKDVYTLLHLNLSHNHLLRVEGVENSALLHTLDLRANSLTEPPSLNNQVLLRELCLDDNSISSLHGLAACWLPLMQHLSVAQNRITQLPVMSDLVSLAHLDLGFNCLLELQNVCESLEGCQLLQDVHLTGNPLQQESGWRSTLQKAVPGLRAIANQETESFFSPPAVQQVSLSSGSFLEFCQTQLQQARDLQQQHSRELSNSSSLLDAVKTSCRHFSEALQLAQDQRYAHEYGDTSVAVGNVAAARTTPVKVTDTDGTSAKKHTERPCADSLEKVPPLTTTSDIDGYSTRTVEETSAAEDVIAANLKIGQKVCKTNLGSVYFLETKGRITSSRLQCEPILSHKDQDLENKAAVVIQQLWRKYRQKYGDISSQSTAERGERRGGDEGMPESGPCYIKRSVIGRTNAATVIQAVWRGYALRRRLASALAAVTCYDTGEDDTLEEVDMDEFVFDEAVLEKQWTPLCEDPTPGNYTESEQLLSSKPTWAFPEPSVVLLPPALVLQSKQAWVADEQVDSTKQRVSPVISNRSKSPASTPVLRGLTERSEKILEEWGFTHSSTALLMLKRAQKMKSKKQHEKKCMDPSAHLAWFKNCSYNMNPVGGSNRRAKHNRNDIKVCEAETSPQQAERTERGKVERAEWLHTQAAHSHRDSESLHFLPEIGADILNGGRVQLVADPGYIERQHHANRSWAKSRSAAQPCKENSYPCRNSAGHARKEVPSKSVTSAPSKKERISFRDNPIQLSGGWGGGKKRSKV